MPTEPQIRLSGSITSSMRGRCFGKEPRLTERGFEAGLVEAVSASSSAWIAAMAVSRSSRARSNCSGLIFSDLRPKAACLKAATSFSSRAMRSSLQNRALLLQSEAPSTQQYYWEDQRHPAWAKLTKSGLDMLEDCAVRVIVPQLSGRCSIAIQL